MIVVFLVLVIVLIDVVCIVVVVVVVCIVVVVVCIVLVAVCIVALDVFFSFLLQLFTVFVAVVNGLFFLVAFFTAPAQLLDWSISSLPLPTHTRLG